MRANPVNSSFVDYGIFDTLVESVVIVDSDGAIKYVNDAAIELFDRSYRRLSRLNIKDLINIENHKYINFNKHFISESSLRLEASIGIDDQNKKPVRFSICPLRDQDVWAFYIYDLSVEASLHNSYQLQIAKKESALVALEKAKGVLSEYFKHLSFFAFAVVYLLVGLSPFVIKTVVIQFPPLLATGMVNVIAGIIAGIYVYLHGNQVATFDEIVNGMKSGFLTMFIRSAAIAWSLQYLEPSIIAICFAAIPIFIHLIMVARKKEKATLNLSLGLGLGIIGTFGLSFSNFSISQLKIEDLAILIVLVSFFSSSYGVSNRMTSERPFVCLWIEIFFGGLLLLAVSFGFESYQKLEVVKYTPALLGAFLYYLVFAILVTNFTITWLGRITTATKSVSAILFAPIVSLLLGWVFNQPIIGIQLLFSSLTVLGAFLIVKSRSKNIPLSQDASW